MASSRRGYHVLEVSSVSVEEENRAMPGCVPPDLLTLPAELPKLRIHVPASPGHSKKYRLQDWEDSR